MTSTSPPRPAEARGAGCSWTPIAWGVAAIALGLLLAARPGPTAVFVVRVVAFLWLVGGVVDLAGVVRRRDRPRAGWRAAGGLLAIVAALLVLADPLVGAVLAIGAQFVLIAVAALVEGCITLVDGLRAGPAWGLVALGALQLGVGVFLFARPVVGLQALVQLLAAVLIVGGVITIVQATRRRRVAPR